MAVRQRQRDVGRRRRTRAAPLRPSHTACAAPIDCHVPRSVSTSAARMRVPLAEVGEAGAVAPGGGDRRREDAIRGFGQGRVPVAREIRKKRNRLVLSTIRFVSPDTIVVAARVARDDAVHCSPPGCTNACGCGPRSQPRPRCSKAEMRDGRNRRLRDEMIRRAASGTLRRDRSEPARERVHGVLHRVGRHARASCRHHVDRREGAFELHVDRQIDSSCGSARALATLTSRTRDLP